MIERSLKNSLQIQLRVIGALFLREVLTRYGRKNIGFLWLFIEPMLFTIVISLIWNITRNTHGFKLPITAFAVTGYSSVLLWRNMVNRCSGALTPNIGLLFHKNVKVIDVFLSRIILELAGASMAFIGISVIFIAFGFMDPPQDVLKIIWGWILLAWFGAALSLVVGALSERSELVDKVWTPMQFFLFPLSGVAFMVDWLGKDFQEIVLMFPMVHGVEIVREGYFGFAARSHYDASYMIKFCLFLTILGLHLSKVTSRAMNPHD